MVAAQPVEVDGAAACARRCLRIFAVLAAIAVVLAGLSLVLLRVTPWPVLRDTSSPVVQFLDVRAEANLHTWFNVSVLSVGAVLHLTTAALARRAHHSAWPWVSTASVLALLSLDDLASLHEQLEPLGRALGAGDGPLHFAWLLPGLVLALGLALTAVLVSLRLPRRAALWLAAGVASLLMAAVGLEAAGGAILSSIGDGPAYIVISHLEEFLETCAAALLLCSALRAISLATDPTSDRVTLAYQPR